MKHVLKITPAIKPEKRHEIEDALKDCGFDVMGGGQATDGGFSDITFFDHTIGRPEKEQPDRADC